MLPPTASITERICGEFREMPGLTLTVAQACRLWNIDQSLGAIALEQLVAAGFLCRRANGAYGRTSDLAARSIRAPRLDRLRLGQPKEPARRRA